MAETGLTRTKTVAVGYNHYLVLGAFSTVRSLSRFVDVSINQSIGSLVGIGIVSCCMIHDAAADAADSADIDKSVSPLLFSTPNQ